MKTGVYTNLFKSTFVFTSSLWIFRIVRLVWKRRVGEDIMVILVSEVLLVLENRVENIHSISGQKTDIPDHPSDASCGESASTEADQDDLIARCIVCSNETVDFSDVLCIS